MIRSAAACIRPVSACPAPPVCSHDRTPPHGSQPWHRSTVLIAVGLVLASCAARRDTESAQQTLIESGCKDGLEALTAAALAHPEYEPAAEAWRAALVSCADQSDGAPAIETALDRTTLLGLPLGEAGTLLGAFLRPEPLECTGSCDSYSLAIEDPIGLESLSVAGVSGTEAADGLWSIQVGRSIITEAIGGTDDSGTVRLDGEASFRGETHAITLTATAWRPPAPLALNPMHHADGNAQFRGFELSTAVHLQTEPGAGVELTLLTPEFHQTTTANAAGEARFFVPGIHSSLLGLARADTDAHSAAEQAVFLDVVPPARWADEASLDRDMDILCDDACQDIRYRELSANIHVHTGTFVRFRGRVAQAQVLDDGYVFVRLAVGNYGADVVGIAYEADRARFLEGDRMTVYGTVAGPYSYTSQAGWQITIPLVRALVIEDSRGRPSVML